MACWAGLACYCALALTLGPSGLVTHYRARVSGELMRLNIESLSAVNAKLADELEGLQRHPEKIALEARSLGYLADNETAVRLPVQAQIVMQSPGKRLYYQASPVLSDSAIKKLAGYAMLAVLVAGCCVRLGVRRGSGRSQRDILDHRASRS